MTEYRVDFRRPRGKRLSKAFTFTLADSPSEAERNVLRHHEGSQIDAVRVLDEHHQPAGDNLKG